jgi:hypothetical protein
MESTTYKTPAAQAIEGGKKRKQTPYPTTTDGNKALSPDDIFGEEAATTVRMKKQSRGEEYAEKETQQEEFEMLPAAQYKEDEQVRKVLI